MTDAIAEAPAADAAVRRPPRSGTRVAVDWLLIIVVAVVAALLIKTYLVEAYVIPSLSMSPTIAVGDRVLVDKLSYDVGSPQRGQIVVFAKPAGDVDPGVKDLIKRVIGLPGQSIRSLPDGAIQVDGRTIAQPWLPPAARTGPGAGPAICSIDRTDCVGRTLHLPAGQYLVMGDNRNDSDDSRYFGPIAGHLIIGRAVVRVWPLSRLHWF